MVIENKQSTVAYRCPFCGCGVMSVVDAFKLSADMVKLKCDCGKSEMTMIKTNDGKIRFKVPCLLCPNPHSFTVSTSLFFGKDLFVLPCPYSDVNVAMMGEMEHVKAELSRSELQLLEMLEENGLDSFDALHTEQVFSDPQVLEIVTYMIKELDEEGKIRCKCEGEGERNYELEMTSDGLLISCPDCGASKLVSTSSLIEAYDFIHTDELILE